MRLILTNDDGIDAPGIRALEQLARNYGEVFVVAPDRPYSGCGHQVTTRKPILVHRLDRHHIRVSGSPADCTRLALRELVSEADWLWSGINHGGNLGMDIFTSGTAAAAREAAALGIPSMAISQVIKPEVKLNWDQTVQQLQPVLDELLGRELYGGNFWNINLPYPRPKKQLAEPVFCPPDPSPLEILFETCEGGYQYAGDYHKRPRVSQHDVDVCASGKISISLIPSQLGS